MGFERRLPRLSEVEGGSGYLQVLLSELTLAPRPGGGILLELRIAPELFCLASPAERGAVQPELDVEEGREVETLVERLRRDGGADPVAVHLERFRFRHASAGILPRLVHSGRELVLLFHRDIQPVGWNIANGASASVDEMADIGRLMRREAAEEVLLFEGGGIVTLAGESSKDAHRAVTEWRRRLGAVAGREAKVRWDMGPDALRVDLPGGPPVLTEGLHIGLHADDFGIECSRACSIECSEDAIPLDGELAGDSLLDRPAGLFTWDGVRREPPRPKAVHRGGRPMTEPPFTTLPRLCPVTAGLLAAIRS